LSFIRNTLKTQDIIFTPVNIVLFIFILDQISKTFILRFLKEPINIIPGFFNIVLVWNKGAAWGMLSKYPSFLTAIAIIALIILIIFFKKISGGKKSTEIALALLIGGISGNLFDRITRGAVVDFLDFYIGKYHWPAFNIADSAITISVIILLVFSLKEDPATSNEEK